MEQPSSKQNIIFNKIELLSYRTILTEMKMSVEDAGDQQCPS